MGKKKEEQAPGGVLPDMGMPQFDQYPQQAQQGYGQQDYYYPQQGYGQQQAGQQQPAQQPMQAPQESAASHEHVEQIAEAIIQEKWAEVEKEFGRLSEWKEDTNTKIVQLTQRVDDLKASFDALHKTLLGKVGEYDENLASVGTEIKAMEKVFSKVLPTLTDSINRFQRVSGGTPAASPPQAQAMRRRVEPL